MVSEPAQHKLKQTVIGCLLQPAEPDHAQGLVLGQGGRGALCSGHACHIKSYRPLSISVCLPGSGRAWSWLPSSTCKAACTMNCWGTSWAKATRRPLPWAFQWLASHITSSPRLSAAWASISMPLGVPLNNTHVYGSIMLHHISC